jgi:hypothetical protein
MNESINAGSMQSAGLYKKSDFAEAIALSGRYTAKCFDKDGNLKWEEEIQNLVTTVGKNKALDTLFANAAGGAIFMGLKGTGTAVVGDTQASHASWLEVGGTNAPAYSGTRLTPTFAAASGGSKATSATVNFTFTSGGTVAGCFINIGGTSAQDNTTGVLYSAGDFSGGNKVVANTDVLQVTYTATA